MKLISKSQINALVNAGKIRNSKYGYINNTGETIGYYRTTTGKCYAEDYYVDLANQLN
jgi:hypothetical protein|nr:MAG TPA: hypothetical protein [Bacteriophage sp.]